MGSTRVWTFLNGVWTMLNLKVTKRQRLKLATGPSQGECEAQPPGFAKYSDMSESQPELSESSGEDSFPD